jgi:colanic acid biosynthesis protein WcaH
MVFSEPGIYSDMSEWLPDGIFQQGIATLPLVSIDLIVRDTKSGTYLLGLRKNRPAINYWFVPGGRIRKNETLGHAFTRITEDELGRPFEIESARWEGVFQHFYEECVFAEGVSTHYIVLAYVLEIHRESLVLPNDQHSDYAWKFKREILNSSRVHPHSQEYFSVDV